MDSLNLHTFQDNKMKIFKPLVGLCLYGMYVCVYVRMCACFSGGKVYQLVVNRNFKANTLYILHKS